MKKNITLYLLIFCVFVYSETIAQGMKFAEGDWASVKEKARVEKKIIFVDAYATWCGPCKWMAKNVFTNDTVGRFYNKNFINYSIDVEKGEGLAFSEKYNVTAMPTLFFIDSAGRMLHASVGSRIVKEFIELGEIALNPEKRFSGWQKKYKSGNREPEFIRGYLNQLSEAGQDVSEIQAWYFATQSEADLLSKVNWEMIKNYVNNYNSKTFDYLLKNKDKYYTVADKEEVNDKIYKVYESSYSGALRRGNDSLFNVIITSIKNSGLEFTDKLILEANMNYSERKGDWKKYSEYSIQFVNKYLMDKNDKEVSMALNQYAWTFYEQNEISDKEVLKNAISWIKKSIELESSYYNYDTYASLLYKTGNKNEAIVAAEKALELAKKDGADFAATQELLEKIKKMK